MVKPGSAAQAMLEEAKASWTKEHGREPDDREFELMVGILLAQLAGFCAKEIKMPAQTFKRMLKDLGFLTEFVDSRVNASSDKVLANGSRIGNTASTGAEATAQNGNPRARRSAMPIPKLFVVRFDYSSGGELVEGAAVVIADSADQARKRFRKLVAEYLDVIPESGRKVVDATGSQIDDQGIADLAIREINHCLDPFFGLISYRNEIDTLFAKVGQGTGEWSEQEADEHARDLEASED